MPNNSRQKLWNKRNEFEIGESNRGNGHFSYCVYQRSVDIDCWTVYVECGPDLDKAERIVRALNALNAKEENATQETKNEKDQASKTDSSSKA